MPRAIQERVERNAAGVLFPFCSEEGLEIEVFFLMDQMNQGYQDAMSIPSSRRHRFVLKKVEQMKEHNANVERANSAARSRSRRR